jgi:hypothetical protein
MIVFVIAYSTVRPGGTIPRGDARVNGCGDAAQDTDLQI